MDIPSLDLCHTRCHVCCFVWGTAMVSFAPFTQVAQGSFCAGATLTLGVRGGETLATKHRAIDASQEAHNHGVGESAASMCAWRWDMSAYLNLLPMRGGVEVRHVLRLTLEG